jgi:uncharacterized protein (DUF58 family)
MREPPSSPHFLSPRNTLAMASAMGVTIGISLHNPLVLCVGAMLGVALALAFVHASGLLKGIQVARVHTARAFEGQTVPVSIEIESHSRLSQGLVLIEDSFPPSGPGRVLHLVERPFGRGQKLFVHYNGECNRHRGLYSIGPLLLEAYDALGLVRRRVHFEEFTPLLLYPASIDLEGTRVHGRGTQFHVGLETYRRPGQSEEFTAVREYHYGDGPNTIHWRSTARRGVPMVKEFREDLTTDVSIFLDMGRMGQTGIGDQTTIEYAIKAAASIARRAYNRGFAMQLFAVGPEIEHIPLGRGARHLLMILDSLALLKVEGASRFDAAVMEHGTRLRRGGTVVLIQGATTVEPASISQIIPRLLQRRIQVICVLVDDRQFVKLFREQEDRHYAASPIETTAALLAELGARVHVLKRAADPIEGMRMGLETVHDGRSGNGR